MASEYETMGVILSCVARSAIVASLRENGSLSLPQLEREATHRLTAIGKSLDRTDYLQKHLKVLERTGIVTNHSDGYRLTEEGSRALERLISG